MAHPRHPAGGHPPKLVVKNESIKFIKSPANPNFFGVWIADVDAKLRSMRSAGNIFISKFSVNVENQFLGLYLSEASRNSLQRRIFLGGAERPYCSRFAAMHDGDSLWRNGRSLVEWAGLQELYLRGTGLRLRYGRKGGRHSSQVLHSLPEFAHY